MPASCGHFYSHFLNQTKRTMYNTLPIQFDIEKRNIHVTITTPSPSAHFCLCPVFSWAGGHTPCSHKY